MLPTHPLQTASVTASDVQRAGASMLELIETLYPYCRSITGPGVRATLARLGERFPLQLTEVPTGTQVFDWTIPREWSIEDAYLEHESGCRFAEFSRCNLHVLGYSVPVDQTMPLAELQPRLHSLPAHPDWVPFRSSYYREDWGFCLSDNARRALPEGNYRAVIRSRLSDGALTLGEFVHRGRGAGEVLIFAHTCHPSLCNDNLSGIAVASQVAQALQGRETRYTYRILFAPATIGSIAWMALNESHLPDIHHGLVLAMLGDGGPMHYQCTKPGNAAIDRSARHVLRTHHPDARVLDFSPWGFDERQFNTPGIGLPVGRLTRALSGHYLPEHTSADSLDKISGAALGEAWLAVLRILELLESNGRWLNLSPKGEPRLGQRGLYRQMGGHYDSVPERHLGLLWLLQLSDGQHSLLDIAERSGLDASLLAACAADLQRAGLLAPAS